MQFFTQLISHIKSNAIPGVIAITGSLLVWLMATVWSTQTQKLSEIAASSESTAASMHELVILVREDRVKIASLETRMEKVETKIDNHAKEVEMFWRNYAPQKRGNN
jgi:hypothetical protein